MVVTISLVITKVMSWMGSLSGSTSPSNCAITSGVRVACEFSDRKLSAWLMTCSISFTVDACVGKGATKGLMRMDCISKKRLTKIS